VRVHPLLNQRLLSIHGPASHHKGHELKEEACHTLDVRAALQALAMP
jgi:hypothetical protein